MLELASALDTMMSPETAVLVALISVVVVSLFFDFTNGWNDSANAIATVVSTRVLKPAHAVVMNAGMNFVGALVSTTVAQTIASKWVDEGAITQWSVVVRPCSPPPPGSPPAPGRACPAAARTR